MQIAGLIARRIVCEVEQKQNLKQGDESVWYVSAVE